MLTAFNVTRAYSLHHAVNYSINTLMTEKFWFQESKKRKWLQKEKMDKSDLKMKPASWASSCMRNFICWPHFTLFKDKNKDIFSAIHSNGHTTTNGCFVNESNRWCDISGRLLWTRLTDMSEISQPLLNNRAEGMKLCHWQIWYCQNGLHIFCLTKSTNLKNK